MAFNQNKGSFWLGLMLGGLLGCVVCATAALLITNAPIPFVEKVQKQAEPVDSAALDGKDPNALLYESGNAKDDPLSAIKTVQAPTANQRAAEQPSNAADQAASGESYSIQAGAFRNAKDAEKVRTELAFIALEADVVKSTDAGITLYRVYLGPFETAREANELQQRLTANGFDAMVIRNK